MLLMGMFAVLAIFGTFTCAKAEDNLPKASPTVVQKVFKAILATRNQYSKDVVARESQPASHYLNVYLVDLKGSGMSDGYLVEGIYEPFVGASDSLYWICANQNGRIVVIGDLGIAKDVHLLPFRNHEYRAIQTTDVVGMKEEVVNTIFLFNGKKYVEKKRPRRK